MYKIDNLHQHSDVGSDLGTWRAMRVMTELSAELRTGILMGLAHPMTCFEGLVVATHQPFVPSLSTLESSAIISVIAWQLLNTDPWMRIISL